MAQKFTERNESFLPDEYRSIYESNLDNQYFVNTGGVSHHDNDNDG